MKSDIFYSPTGWEVPTGVQKVVLECFGGSGDRGYNESGGHGGHAIGSLEVTAGDILYIDFSPGGSSSDGKYAGGDSADVRVGGESLTDRILVAGGGGAAGYNSGDNGGPGAGGADVGEDGPPTGKSSTSAAQGGTQSQGGAGADTYIQNGDPGEFGAGGDPADTGPGGGGAGWYGGGGGCTLNPSSGAKYDLDGAGGSNYVDTDLLDNTESNRGVNSGQAYVRIEYQYSGPSSLKSGNWESYQLKRYNGNTWNPHVLKKYNGTSWEWV